tara:strand:- start:780 stop:1082 length:303 start_codon:yes stop_codon:yes gene_type:complete
MIMEDNSLFIFMKVCEDFVKSTLELRNAAALCDDDPIKQEMIAFVAPEFNNMWAKSEGIKVLLEKEHFAENREFILSEMREVTLHNRQIAAKIEEKLGSL